MKHGLGGYRHGACRCDICRQANSAAVTDYRRRRRAWAREHPETIRHGTRSAYLDDGCRCEPCRYAYSVYQRIGRALRE